MNLLFLGNSYTHRGPLPILVHRLALASGTSAMCYAHAPEAASLETHLMSDEVEYTMSAGEWDVLILQEHSTRPTRTLGDPGASTRNALALADMFLQHNPRAAIVVVQTWARHPDHQSWLPAEHAFYPHTFDDPSQMLGELTDGLLQTLGQLGRMTPRVSMVRVGDVWLNARGARLHDPDGSHANQLGQRVSALLIYHHVWGKWPDGLGADWGPALDIIAGRQLASGPAG